MIMRKSRPRQTVIIVKLQDGKKINILEGTYELGEKMAVPKSMVVRPSGEDDNFTIQVAADNMAKKRVKILGRPNRSEKKRKMFYM